MKSNPGHNLNHWFISWAFTEPPTQTVMLMIQSNLKRVVKIKNPVLDC